MEAFSSPSSSEQKISLISAFHLHLDTVWMINYEERCSLLHEFKTIAYTPAYSFHLMYGQLQQKPTVTSETEIHRGYDARTAICNLLLALSSTPHSTKCQRKVELALTSRISGQGKATRTLLHAASRAFVLPSSFTASLIHGLSKYLIILAHS